MKFSNLSNLDLVKSRAHERNSERDHMKSANKEIIIIKYTLF